MAYQQNKEQPNVNTDATGLRNSDSAHQSAMNIGYWNALLSIKIYPALDKSQQTEANPFNWDKNTSTAITLEKIIILADSIESHVLPALAEGKPVFRGIEVGENGLVGIGVDTSGETPEAYFAIYKGLDAGTRKPTAYDKYMFKASNVINDYSPDDGSFTVSKGTQSEIALFLSILRASIVGLGNSTVHADRNVNRAFRERFTGQLDEIAVKLGLESKKAKSNGYNRSGNKSDSVFSGGTPAGNLPERSFNDSEVPIKKAESTDDLNHYYNE